MAARRMPAVRRGRASQQGREPAASRCGGCGKFSPGEKFIKTRIDDESDLTEVPVCSECYYNRSGRCAVCWELVLDVGETPQVQLEDVEDRQERAPLRPSDPLIAVDRYVCLRCLKEGQARGSMLACRTGCGTSIIYMKEDVAVVDGERLITTRPAGRVPPNADICDSCRILELGQSRGPYYYAQPCVCGGVGRDVVKNRERCKALVHGYHKGKPFKPIESEWVASQPVPIYFGVEVELEVLTGSSEDRDTKDARKNAVATHIINSIGPANGSFLLYDLQDDGSLNHGIEVITQPAGLDVHRKRWPGVDFLESLASSDEEETCGMHIHVTKAALDDETIDKMVDFINDRQNTKFMVRLARRSFENAKVRDYARRSRGDRYNTLNTTGDKTVEFRLPQGTLEPTTILATLEFVYLLVRFCERASDEELLADNFIEFVAYPEWAADSRFLRAYFADKRLATPKQLGLPEKPSGIRSNPAPARGYYAGLALEEYLETGELTQ